jgi:hypothetical protein
MQDGNMDEVRYWMVKETAPKPLDHARGSKFDYCNLGYVIAGAVLERTGGKTWEELIDARIFEPLAPAPVLTHTGSNQMNLAIAMFWPETDFGFVLMTNVSGNPADDALGKLAANLYKSFSEKP